MSHTSIEADSQPAVSVLGELPGGLADALRNARAESRTRNDFYRSALRVLANHFQAPYAAIHLEDSTQSLEDEVCRDGRKGDKSDVSTSRRWKPLCDALLLDARYHHLATARLHESPDSKDQFAVMAVPIAEEQAGTIGSLAVVAACEGKADAASQLALLESSVRTMALHAATAGRQRPSPSSSPEHSALAKAAAYTDLHGLAFALANGLKTKLACDQVSIGLVRGRSIEVLCVSGQDDLYPRSPGTRWIRQAMEECLDAGRPLCFQREDSATGDAVATGHLLHQRWHHHTAGAAVASIPLLHEGRPAAVVALRRGGDQAFQHDQLQRIESLATPLVPGLLLLEKAGRSLFKHAIETARLTWHRWTSPGAWGRKAALLTTALAALWLAVGKMQLVVTVPCQVMPREITQIAAPLEGVILAAHVEPGDRVAAGQLLVELDVRELRLERDRLLAEERVAQLELSEALQNRDRAAAAQAQSRLDIVEANLRVVDHRLAHGSIRAPEAGIILKGEPRQRVGEVVPLGAPLLEFSPHGNWCVELHAPEFSAVHLQTGQVGQFTTTARPDHPQDCRLSRMELAAEVIEGRNVFVARADMQGSPEWIRGGMTGVARIEAGRRPVWWVILHRLIDSIRLQLWKL